MARANRVVLKDAVYHITSRVAHREFLFASASFKDRMAEWIHGVAEFSGVEVYAWSVLDNHFHLVVRVPGVPREYWTDPDHEPDSHAFGMRPAECHVPRWSPAGGDSPQATSRSALVGGDSPQGGAAAAGDAAGGDSPRREARPGVGFMLPDEEMLGRLLSLYGSERRVERLRRAWREMRLDGNGAAVDAVKERYARRMYNVSQFAKTLKERIAMVYNQEFEHEGVVWQGRFHSSLVEDADEVRAIVAAYDDYNPVKAGIVDHPSQYRWCSFGSAAGNGRFAETSRRGYEKMLGCTWEEARVRMEAIFTFKDMLSNISGLGNGVPTSGDGISASGNGVPDSNDGMPKGRAEKKLNVALAIRQRVPAFTRGVYIGHNAGLASKVASSLPRNFPRSSFAAAVKGCCQFMWDLVA